MVEIDITKRKNDDNNNDDRPVVGACVALSAIAVITIVCLITIYLVGK